MTKTMLENLYHDALTLMERMRDYVARDARQDRLALPWSERVVMLQTNRVLTVRLCHALQLIQAHQARLAGEDAMRDQAPPRILLSALPLDPIRDIVPSRLVTLAEDANHLFERLHAVHLAIVPDDPAPFQALMPGQEVMEDEEELAYA